MGYAVNKSVIRLTRSQVAGPLPPLLAETLPLLPDLQAGHSLAVVCKGTSCLPPVREPEHCWSYCRTSLALLSWKDG